MIQIDTGSAVPIYDQIKAGFKGLVSKGLLRPGDPVPSVRSLAAKLKVNPNTVARAFRELALEGVLESQRGSGNVVSDRAAQKAHDGLDLVCRGFAESIRQARRSGLEWGDIEKELKRVKGEEK